MRSEHRADLPRHEFVVAVAEFLGFCLPPGGGVEQQVVDPLAHLLEAHALLDHHAAVDVHVFGHLPEQGAVGGELDRGSGLRAEARAAPRGEGDEIGPGSDLARGRHRVVSRAVHIDEARDPNLFGIGEGPGERRQPAFRDRAQALFQDRGQAALLVAGRGVVVEAGAVLRGIVAPPVDHGADFCPGGRIAPRDQQMLGAVDFGRFRQDRGAACGHQHIRGDAKRRVRGDARKPVRAAALHAQHQLRHRLFAAAVGIGGGTDRLQKLHRAAHGRSRAAHILDIEDTDAFLGPVAALIERELVHFAAEPDDQHAPEVRMVAVALQHAHQRVEAFALVGHAAALIVHDRGEAVDIGEARQQQPVRRLGDGIADGGGAVHRGEDADVVARAHAPARPGEALEGGARGRRMEHAGGAGLIGMAVRHGGIVAVHMGAGGDVFGRDRHHLAVFDDRRTLRHRGDREFVPLRNIREQGDAKRRLARFQRAQRHADGIGRAQMHEGGAGGGHARALSRMACRRGVAGASGPSQPRKAPIRRSAFCGWFCAISAMR